ncbi:hypothetical protein IWW52_003714, partial [Coemansia sp. RSA 2704]
VGSGEMYWNSALSQASEGNVDVSAESDVHDIFYRSLDNLVDKALMPLSIVRFGFRQWITLDGADTASAGNASNACTEPLPDDWQLPPTPASPSTCMQLDAGGFIADSNSLEHKQPANAQAADIAAGAESNSAKCVRLLRFTTSTSSQALLLQHSSQTADHLSLMARLDEIVAKYSNAPLASQAQSTDSPELSPIAAARIAPYGTPAMVLSVPTEFLGDTEDQTLEAWSSLFGYSRDLLASSPSHGAQPASSLVWIRMADGDEPMLYPRRLVFIDEVETAALYAVNPTETAAPDTEASAGQSESTAEPSGHTVPNEEREEGEDVEAEEAEEGEECEEGEEGEFNEEGEIADPPAVSDPLLPAATDLGETIAELDPQPLRVLESSLAAIRESMVQFHAERQAEEAEEEARKREKLAQQPASKAKVNDKAGKANGTRKRQRSNARDEGGPSKAQRKTDTKDTRSESSNDDIPLQALVDFTAPAPAAEQAENVEGIESLLAPTAEAGDAPGDMSLGFGQMGDDMGLGMGMENMGSGIGDFGASMFGVTDDDFNFFDSVPAQPQSQPKIEAAVQPPLSADAMSIDLKSEPMFGDPASSQPVDALAPGDASQPLPEAMDDMFDDDNMFDSFFGGPATSAEATSIDAGFLEPAVTDAIAAAPVSAAEFADNTTAATLMQALSSPPPGIAGALSATETHVGSVEPSLAMDVDLATPASIKMTPAPSTDILTPTPTNVGALPKSGAASEEPVRAHGAESQPAPGLMASTVRATAGVSTETPRKPLATASKQRNPTVTPKPYSSISTPFDDIGSSSRSWLRDQPTPATLDDTDVLDPQHMQHAALLEKSLNPVAWIKRVSARQLQARPLDGRIPASVRRLRGWLTSYKAKRSYTSGFIPAHVRGAQAAEQQAAEAEQEQQQPDAQESRGESHSQYPVAVQPKERDGQMSFMNIINPRSTQATQLVHMPGALPLSLDMGSLQAANAPSPAASSDGRAVSTQAVCGHWVPLWMRVSGAAAELFVGVAAADGLTWAAVFAALVPSARRALLAATAKKSRPLYMADIPLVCPPDTGRRTAVVPVNLGARLGGLLTLGARHSQDDDGTHNAPLSPVASAATATTDLVAATPSDWAAQLRLDSSWSDIVEMLGDWAATSAMLDCVDHSEPRPVETETAWARGPLTAIAACWGGSDDHSGALTLGRLVSLDSAAPTARYRGYVVKKRRAGGSSSASDGAVTVPTGAGAVEPLADVRVVVGTHGQQDAGIGALRRRDAESLYVKRWRYAQRLAARAAHAARVAAGEIEEAEEGEEREDGAEPAADWPDPDGFAAEPEDALRRVCITASAPALRWWSQLHMRPVGGSKDVRWAALAPSRELGRYLDDVDSAYQAAHLGAHRPLMLGPDGSSSEGLNSGGLQGFDRCALPALRSAAQRLGRAAAHAWHAASQLEQAQATSVVLYVAVPQAQSAAPWLALAAAACAATRAFGDALARLGAHGPVRWPTLTVHPLPAAARRPSPLQTALAVYARCPAFLPQAQPQSTRTGPLVRRASYFVSTARAKCTPAFAHRAFAVSLPAAFPQPGCAVAGACLPPRRRHAADAIPPDSALDEVRVRFGTPPDSS